MHPDNNLSNREVLELMLEEARQRNVALLEALECCVGLITGEHSDTQTDKAQVLEMAKQAIAKTK